jgi:hypothetical protein
LIDKLAENLRWEDITIQHASSQHIISQNITSQETTIAYYYCDFSNPKSLESFNIIGGIIRQLLEQIVIPNDLEQQIDSFYRLGARTPTDDELISILPSVFKHFSKVFIFIDGLDECRKEEQATISSMAHKLSQSQFPVIKILITSREEAVISTSLIGLPRLRITAENVSTDIASFVEETIKYNIRSGTLVLQDPSLESDIISALINGAQGM